MGANGGRRPGAGRKPKADKYAGAINRAEKKIVDHLPTLVDRMVELANGITVEEPDATGETRIYTRPPDRAAAQYLIDRILGKTTQRVEATGEHGGPLVVRVEYDDDDQDGETTPPAFGPAPD